MARSFHWSGAAEEYEHMYRRLLGQPTARPLAHAPTPRMPVRARVTELQAAA
jgi:hypothetical protein